MRRLYLDYDGVLADFDTGFFNFTGMKSAEYEDTHGSKVFWNVIRSHKSFFEHLPLMPDALELFDAVKHVRPIILTGVPFGGWAAPQKYKHRDKHFSGIPVVTCPSKDKCLFCQPGDILVDDLEKYKHLWEAAGGTFILHTSAKNSILKLTELGVI